MATNRRASVCFAASVLAISSAILVAARVEAHAQRKVPTRASRPDLYTLLDDDSTYVCRITYSGDTIPANQISTTYQFEMLYDSTSVTRYTLGELCLNGERLKLMKWKEGRRVNANSDLLSFNSRSVAARLNVNDTISMYRELAWFDPRTHVQDSANYHALDSLDYCIELVRQSDGIRLARIDSVGILACAQPGTPVVHGTRPIIANVRYVVPAALAGETAFVRVRLYAKGDGEYYFTRTESVAIGLSLTLEDPYWLTYLMKWGQLLGKLVRPEVDKRDRFAAGASLQVTRSAEDLSTLIITFNSSPRHGSTTVALYDMNGGVIYYPFSSMGTSGEYQAVYRCDHNGSYVVALIHDGVLTSTAKINVVR